MTLMGWLAVLGAAVLLALGMHWAWQERKAKPRQPDAADAVQRVEPTLGQDAIIEPGDPVLDHAAPLSPANVLGNLPAGAAPWSQTADGRERIEPSVRDWPSGAGPANASPREGEHLAPRASGDVTPRASSDGSSRPREGLAPDAVRAVPTLNDANTLPAGMRPERVVVGAMPSGVADVLRQETLHMPTLVRREVRLDASIDAVAPIVLEAAISGDMAQVHLPTARRAGSKAFHIEARNVDTQSWESPAPGHLYREFQAGVQLANRNGALNAIEYSEFVQKVQAFADAIGARLDAPDMIEVVARARQLDGFAQANDAVLNAELHSNGAAWSVGFVQQCAARHGFVAGGLPGRLVLPSAEHDQGEPPILALTFDGKAAMADDPTRAVVRKVRLALDVPQTPESAEPFAAWHRTATNLARDMSASLVDDEGNAIPLQAFATIQQQLGEVYSRMASQGLQAGSPTARRLFS
jgi:hypothetical protein